MFQSVIFDLDGTLLDTLEDLTNAANDTCRQNGWPEHSQDSIRQLVGNGVPNLVRSLSPSGSHSPLLMIAAVQQFCKHYQDHDTDCSCPYPGVMEMLQQLKAAGVTMGVYSNKKHSFCKELVNHYFPDLFVVAQGKEEGLPLKPSLEGTEHVLKAMGVDSKTTLFVGDSMGDVQTAHNANMASCAVTWGFRDAQQLKESNPTYLVDSTQAIVDIVLGK